MSTQEAILLILIVNVLGITLLYWVHTRNIRQGERCTLPVTAQIDKVRELNDFDYGADYWYSYEGYYYTGTTMRRCSESEARRSYPRGSSITVYIDPENPHRSREFYAGKMP